MSIYKVERKVDTVIVEMDIDVAEKLTTVLGLVRDKSFTAKHNPAILNLFNMLIDDAEVRWPSPLYEAHTSDDFDGCVDVMNVRF